MGLMAERAADRMQARQTYRTMSRMQRRRSYVEDKLGVREDFSSPRTSRRLKPPSQLLPQSPPSPTT